MAIGSNEIKRMQRDIETLKKKMARLEKRRTNKRQTPVRKREQIATGAQQISEGSRGREILRRAGAIREMTSAEKAIAEKWDALPEARKQHIIQKLGATRLVPPLSETIIQDRG